MKTERIIRISLGFMIAILMQFFFMLPSAAQPASPRQYIYKQWNNQTGLPQNTVFDLVKDDRGYLWIATEEGLVRFDSHDFA